MSDAEKALQHYTRLADEAKALRLDDQTPCRHCAKPRNQHEVYFDWHGSPHKFYCRFLEFEAAG